MKYGYTGVWYEWCGIVLLIHWRCSVYVESLNENLRMPS